MKKLDQFGKCAGLKTNKSKTEALWLGPPKGQIYMISSNLPKPLSHPKS